MIELLLQKLADSFSDYLASVGVYPLSNELIHSVDKSLGKLYTDDPHFGHPCTTQFSKPLK
ncbi:protein of unknown function [Thermococcus camini]|uniref:Uncharacterized protein n=1 Tax=Thermococcus camini TaxID=2016373 RepID=A0A7G2DCX1_9EURY|nr:protein of unknown function [Thermococcus camini]